MAPAKFALFQFLKLHNVFDGTFVAEKVWEEARFEIDKLDKMATIESENATFVALRVQATRIKISVEKCFIDYGETYECD